MIDRAWPSVDHNGTDFDSARSGESEARADDLSAGAMLRHAREQAGLHIGSLAVSLKVPVKKLEALEADRIDLLPDVVFARALALSVCRALKVDANLILHRLPQSGKSQFKNNIAGINTPFRAAGELRMSRWGQASRRSVGIGVLLVLGALGLVLLPSLTRAVDSMGNNAVYRAVAHSMSMWTTSPGSNADGRDPISQQSESDAEKPGFTSPTEKILSNVGLVDQALSASGRPAPVTLANLNAGGNDVLPTTVYPTVITAGQSEKLLAEVVVFTAKSDSWVEVTDAKGQVILRRMLATGEAAGVSGMLPLAAVVGRADTTSVQVRGKPFELISHTRNNVARFEVK